MRSTWILVVALLGSLLATSACADPTSTVGDTIETAKDVVGGITGDVKDTTHQLPDQRGNDGRLGAAADAVGRFFQQVGAAATTTATAISGATGAAADAALLATKAVASGAVATLRVVGSGAGATVRAVGSALTAVLAGVAAMVSSYAGWIQSIRPAKFPAPAYTALAAGGATAASGAAVLGLWSLLKKFGWMMSGIGGFSRIEDDELLNHPLRARVFQTIQATPGIHASELTRRLDVGWGTIVHHLEKMEKAKLLAVRRINNQRCYFEAGGKVSRMDMQTAGAVRAGSAHDIAQFVASNPMTSQKALAERLEMSAALASFHVKKLVGLGVLTKVRRGKETLLSVSESLRRVISDATPVPAAAPPMAVQVPVLA